MGSLLSVHDMAMENDWDDDGWGNSRHGSRNRSQQQHGMRRKPSRRNFDYRDDVQLNMGQSVYLSGPNRKVNTRSSKSADASESVTFGVFNIDSNSGKYSIVENKMPIWTEILFVEFPQNMGTDTMNKAIIAVRLQSKTNATTYYLVPWSSFVQNFTPFDKENSTKPDNSTRPDDEQWKGYLFNDAVWKLNGTHNEALTQAQKALSQDSGGRGGYRG